MLAAIDLVVQNRAGYTLGSVFNEIDFETLSEMMKSSESNDSKKSKTVITTSDGTRVVPGQMGVDAGGRPVMSLAELIKKT